MNNNPMGYNLKGLKIAVIILLTFSLRVSAPSAVSLTISESVPVNPYRQLAYAVGMVETKCDTLAFNPREEAAGIFQIRPIRLEDYNKRTGSSYTLNDLFKYEISEKIFFYYADMAGPYNFEQIARKWNGSGHLTLNYWNRIRRFL